MSDGIAMKDKAKIQNLIEFNTIRAGGNFHSDQLDKDSFAMDIGNNFNLKPLESGKEPMELLDEIIEASMVKVVGRFKTKEFKQSIFFKKLSNNFELEKK